MSLQTAKTVAGVVAIVGMYQFLHIKDPTYPSILTLISYAIHCITMLSVAFGGYYGIHQYLGMIKYTITEDILGMKQTIKDDGKKANLKSASKYTEQDSDPEDPANYTNIG